MFNGKYREPRRRTSFVAIAIAAMFMVPYRLPSHWCRSAVSIAGDKRAPAFLSRLLLHLIGLKSRFCTDGKNRCLEMAVSSIQ